MLTLHRSTSKVWVYINPLMKGKAFRFTEVRPGDWELQVDGPGFSFSCMRLVTTPRPKLCAESYSLRARLSSPGPCGLQEVAQKACEALANKILVPNTIGFGGDGHLRLQAEGLCLLLPGQDCLEVPYGTVTPESLAALVSEELERGLPRDTCLEVTLTDSKGQETAVRRQLP